MTRAELTEKIVVLMRKKKLTWRELASKLGPLSPVYYTAALLGQMKLSRAEAEVAGEALSLDDDEVALLQEIPYRGSLPSMPPSDPLIYRFYELTQVYGTTLKALVQEEFGDGIMSAIDFDLAVERQPDPKGDRVRITLSGKFLPFKQY